ncbi:SAM-dependent methyltransferase [Helicobacter baculiformis]|uniref:SAM-dependent methyltransferase n=1 Tax=Helicobacter baculiformis TaxID=427351 RepID=A0ABV7ZKP1_9HELI|nr:SAM-dependent methyltransferase [Helicobacter baculiformis]
MPQPFSTLMHTWLYDDGGGYYTRAHVGMQGDFYTSVSTSAFFGGSLAFYLLKLLENGQLHIPLKIIEIGAHYGKLMGDVLSFLRALSQGVLEHVEFITLEPLESLRIIQAQHLARMGIKLTTLAALSDLRLSSDCSVFVYNNELWDSFPCEIVRGKQMLYIDHFKPLWIEKVQPSEIGCKPYWQPYVSTLVERLSHARAWVLASFDYGQYGARGQIDLRAYLQHRVLDFQDILDNLEKLYQHTDLTYDVDFQSLEALFKLTGAYTLFYGTQSQALIHMGLAQLLELFEAHMPFSTYQREAFKARALLDPSAFGARFKALISASYPTPL